MELEVRRIERLTDRISLFELAGADLPGWSAGAHVDFETPAGVRSYSLIRFPGETDESWRIAVQREDAGEGGSRAMHALKPGDRLRASAPKNDFPLADSPRPSVLLAGGIGITPLISMATELAAAGRPFTLHYAGRSRSVMAFLEPLAAAFGPALAVHPDDEAPLDLAGVMDPGAEIYICGPRGMIEAARRAAAAAGVPEAQVHVELFATPQAEAGDAPFEVEIASTGQVFTVPPGKSIIEVLEDGGIDLVYDCQRGDCGICQTGVLEGEPDHRDVVLSEAERASGKVMQICVSRAKSPRLKLDL